MSRAPFQILVFPFRILPDKKILYAVFKRSDTGYWQGIAGGGEDDETPLEAAKRESSEEAGIDPDNNYIKLDSFSTIPAVGISGLIWGEDILVVPQYCFGVEVADKDLRLSGEHDEFKWLGYDKAREILHWDSNKNALWELNQRLQ
jgi:dATP pyrophosphohydrolase